MFDQVDTALNSVAGEIRNHLLPFFSVRSQRHTGPELAAASPGILISVAFWGTFAGLTVGSE